MLAPPELAAWSRCRIYFEGSREGFKIGSRTGQFGQPDLVGYKPD
jgi:hypothetical protein